MNLGFILLNAMVWLALGLVIALHAHPSLPANPILQKSMAFLSLCAAGLLLVLFFQLRKRFRPAWFAALGSLVVASLLTILDDFGWSDLVVVALNLVPIFLLIKDRAWYLQEQTAVP